MIVGLALGGTGCDVGPSGPDVGGDRPRPIEADSAEAADAIVLVLDWIPNLLGEPIPANPDAWDSYFPSYDGQALTTSLPDALRDPGEEFLGLAGPGGALVLVAPEEAAAASPGTPGEGPVVGVVVVAIPIAYYAIGGVGVVAVALSSYLQQNPEAVQAAVDATAYLAESVHAQARHWWATMSDVAAKAKKTQPSCAGMIQVAGNGAVYAAPSPELGIYNTYVSICADSWSPLIHKSAWAIYTGVDAVETNVWFSNVGSVTLLAQESGSPSLLTVSPYSGYDLPVWRVPTTINITPGAGAFQAQGFTSINVLPAP